MRFASVDRISNLTEQFLDTWRAGEDLCCEVVASGTAFLHLCSARVKRKFCPEDIEYWALLMSAAFFESAVYCTLYMFKANIRYGF